jgi:hypothetical protein
MQSDGSDDTEEKKWSSEIGARRVIEGKKKTEEAKKESNLSFHSNSVLARPLAGRGLVPGSIGLVNVRDFGHKRIIRVGVCEHRADGEQD